MAKWSTTLVAIHVLVLLLLFINTYLFLIRQKRYKVFYMSLFYAVSIAIMVLRTAYFSLVLAYLSEWQNHQSLCPYRSLNNVDNFSVYCDLALGVQTMSMMVDLALNVKTAAVRDYQDRQTMIESQTEMMTQVNKSKKINHILSSLLVSVTMVSCIALSFPSLIEDQKQSVIFSLATSVYFTLVALLLMWSLINLLLTLRISNMPEDLRSDLCKINVFLIYYSIVFSIRAIAVTLVYFKLWPQFNRSW